MTIGNIASVSVADKPFDNEIAWFIGASLVPILYLVAGVRLLKGEGWICGSLAVIAFALDLVAFGPERTSIQAATVLAVKATLFILVANGVRGALALRAVDYNAENDRVFS